MKIRAWLKPHCGWSNGVRAIFQKYHLAFDDIDIINEPANYAQMVELSGQTLSPCVEIDGMMLADVSGEEVENFMLGNNLVESNDNETAVPTNAPCAHEMSDAIASKTMRFF